MFLDYLFFVSLATTTFKWGFEGKISAEAAGILLVACAVGIGALRIVGSETFRKNVQPLKVVASAVAFGLNFMQGDLRVAMLLTVLMFAAGLIMFGFYVMLMPNFASRRGHSSNISAIHLLTQE
jgi:hypothetical protein